MASETARLTIIKASSKQQKDQILNSISSNSPSAGSTSCWFTPTTRKGGMPLGYPPSASSEAKDLLIGSLEISNSKASNVGSLVESNEWKPVAGFLSRGKPTKSADNIVVAARFVCKKDDGATEKMIENFGKYTSWVEANESGVVTYCLLRRIEVPNETLVFERYADTAALKSHATTKEFKAMFKSIAPHIEVKQTKMGEWTEVEGSFVETVTGALQSKL